MESTHVYLNSKPRYEILDGLRGVASMIVVAFHLFETYAADASHQILNHGYLAVDFFFVLSGFVIGYAYDDRWNRMSFKDFVKRRLVRLHPMVIMGTLIGAALYYLAAGDAFPLIATTPWWKMLLLAVLGCLMIPTPRSLDIRGWSEINSLNGPVWSLMWEYIANLLYALVIRRFSKVMLGILVGVAAALTLNLTLNLNLTGLLPVDRPTAYTVIGGWSITADQAFIALSRLLYPFFMGLLLSRLGARISVKRGFWWCALLVAAILVMPRIGGAERPWLNGAYEAVSILVLFPVIVSMGAGSTVQGRRSTAVCKFLGEISYPLYITHYPLIYLHIAWAKTHPAASTGSIVCLSVGLFVLAVGMAYACLKLYDLPMRDYLKRHWLMH